MEFVRSVISSTNVKSFPSFHQFFGYDQNYLKMNAQNYLSQRCLVSDLTSSLFDTDMQGSMLRDNDDDDDVVAECNADEKDII